MKSKSDPSFGIPITKGKLLSKTDNGFVVSFNFDHLLLKRLLSGQIYSKDRQPLTPIITPISLPNIFQYPMLPNSPDFALAQKEFTIILFIKTPKFRFSPDLRIIFWFQRSVIPAINENNYHDVPDEYMLLVIAKTKKNSLLHQAKPIPIELEEEIRDRTEKMIEDGNPQNYYVTDTFNPTSDELEKLSKDSISKPSPKMKSKGNSRKRKSNIKELDKDAKKYIKANLSFYRDPRNEGEKPTQKQLATLMKMDDGTLSRRLTDVDAPEFLKRIYTKMKLILNSEKFENIIGRPQEDEDKNVLPHIMIATDNKISAMKIRTGSPINRSKEEPENANQFDKLNKEVATIEIDEGANVTRKCDCCGKEYKVYISEDSVPGKWAEAAKNDPQYYSDLVCSIECYNKILKQNNLDPANHPYLRH